jgi:hypothetical protein
MRQLFYAKVSGGTFAGWRGASCVALQTATASTLTIAFLLEGEGVQSIDDESWAIDNLRVTTHND